MRNISVEMLLAVIVSSPVFCTAQSSQDVQALFSELQTTATTDEAFPRLKAMAQNNTSARQYVAAQLPVVITKTSERDAWQNLVKLAGDLKIAETVPVLVKYFDGEMRANFTKPESHVNFATTITERDRLDDDSVGKALAKIGEPAIEPLRNILENYDNNQSLRMRSVLVLYNMNLSPADQVLARQLQSETDPRVKSVIESRIRARKEMNKTK